MQSHIQQEFAASVSQGAILAESQKGRWLKVTGKQHTVDGSECISFHVDGRRADDGSLGNDEGGHDFETDPWTWHAVQFEGKALPALVVKCRRGPSHYQARLTVAGTGTDGQNGLPWCDGGLQTRVRSLGYVGSFVREYRGTAALLAGVRTSRLLPAVAAPGICQTEGTFVPPNNAAIDTSGVPLNCTQRRAVNNLSGGLDIIVGPPGTGKSTTIWHIINSRVTPGARTLVTCIRNQALDAVSRKVASLGVLVFGNEARLGEYAREYTMEERMLSDPELVFWRGKVKSWEKMKQAATLLSWTEVNRASFPGILRLRRAQMKGDAAADSAEEVDQAQVRKLQDKGYAARMWIKVIEYAFRKAYNGRLSELQRSIFKEAIDVAKWLRLLEIGLNKAKAMLARLEILTRHRIYTQTKVLLCTVDSIDRMTREMKEGTRDASLALGSGTASSAKSKRLDIDTAIMDEAACVLETAVPVILALGVNNLTLIGDQHQLQPFSHVRDDGGESKHSRSLMERAVEAGVPSQFLDTQYRMHPAICEMISSTFYEDMLSTGPETARIRKALKPLKWIHVSGGETHHPGRGYSNLGEVPQVVKQSLIATEKYGHNAEIRVITFYNMQKYALEREFTKHSRLSHVLIASVDACQGSDADVVIVSAVRSGGLSGFMLDRRRVNVALSRAKEECIVVGDRDTFRNDGGRMWRSVVRHFSS